MVGPVGRPGGSSAGGRERRDRDLLEGEAVVVGEEREPEVGGRPEVAGRQVHVPATAHTCQGEEVSGSSVDGMVCGVLQAAFGPGPGGRGGGGRRHRVWGSDHLVDVQEGKHHGWRRV